MANLATVTITDLTTIFTPPADCARSWTYEDEFYNSISGGLFIQNADSTSIDSTCFPESFRGNGRAPSSIQVYSPGWCPGGYATPGQFQAGGTTTAICCPSDFSYGSTYSTINFFDSSSVLFMGCISSFSGTTTVSARGNSSMIPVSGSDITLWAQPISVEYQQRDLSLFDISTDTQATDATTSGGGISNTASLPSNTATNPGAAQTSGGSQSSSTSEPSSGGLSTGATAGIAVAASLLGVGLVAGLVFFILRKRRNARRAAGQGKRDGTEDAYHLNDSKEPFRQPQDWERRELDASAAAEYRPELDGRESTPGGGFQGRPVRPKQSPGTYSELE